jgi:hypothetical protein
MLPSFAPHHICTNQGIDHSIPLVMHMFQLNLGSFKLNSTKNNKKNTSALGQTRLVFSAKLWQILLKHPLPSNWSLYNIENSNTTLKLQIEF